MKNKIGLENALNNFKAERTCENATCISNLSETKQVLILIIETLLDEDKIDAGTDLNEIRRERINSIKKEIKNEKSLLH